MKYKSLSTVLKTGIIGFWLICIGRPTLAIADEAPGDSDAQTTPADADAAEHFRSHVAPLLTRHCTECHGATSKKGRLDLSRKEVAFAGGDSGPSIVPGDAAESLLWEFVESDEMPENRPPLSPREKEILRQWIDAGATWPDGVTVGGTPDEEVIAANWLRRLTVPEYIETVRQAVGVEVRKDARELLPRDVRADGFSNTAYNLSVDLEHIEAYAKLAEIIVGRMDVAAFAAEHAPCQELSEECMPEVVAGIGKWLLRGPLEDHEIAAFLRVSTAVADEGGDAHEAVAYVVEAMLQSPRFLYRIERQRGGDAGDRRVDPYELASRLSYILWGGPPDRELMRAADAGELADRDAVEGQVQRMLEDPRTIDRSSQFIAEWLNLEQLDYLRPNPERFPRWNSAIAADMREETLAYFNEVVWEQNRPLWDLMNAQVTFVTPRLAEHYGLDPAKGVEVPETATPSRRSEPSAERAKTRAADGLQVLYTFDEGSGDRVRDSSGAGEPLDLKIEDAGAVTWSHGGLTIDGSTRIATAEPPKRLIEAIRISNAITIEAWITPTNDSQAGPARIVTLSADTGARNFTLGQFGDAFETRLRTTATSGNGEPSLSSPKGTAGTDQTHIVYTRDELGDAVIYIDGREADRRYLDGDFSNWDDGFRLAVANELSKDRPWRGTLRRIAVYNRALSAGDVRQNHAAGASDDPSPALARPVGDRRVTEDLQAFYAFDEGSGDRVRDSSGAAEPLDLEIEDTGAVAWTREGLAITGSTQIATSQPSTRMIEAIKKSNAVTLEAWVTPANTSQHGPARIATLSENSSARNFTLGQEGDKYDVRFRTTQTDDNGMPSLASPSGAVQVRSTHLVYTRDTSGKAKLYVDGQEVSSGDVGGELSNWDGGFRFAIANELSKDRLWKGMLHAVAVYSRALSAEEVERNHAAGGRHGAALALAGSVSRANRPSDGNLQALYQFDEGVGQMVRDTSGSGETLDLRIDDPAGVSWGENGLTVNQSTRIVSDGPPKGLVRAVQESNAITLEAWVTPANDSQSGPARIITLSSGISQRNFTLGQDGNKYDVRLRATQTDGNGLPGLASTGGRAVTQPTHVVYTRDSGAQARLFIDGVEVARSYVQGDMSNWDGGFTLSLANEVSGDRPWLGTLHRVAIYSRALTPQEVLSNSRINTPLMRFDLASVPARGGLLTQGSVLTIGGDEASMVTRGLFVLKDLLYDQVGDPPPCLDTTPVPTKPGLSQREVAMERVKSASCGGCHSRFEPLAFGLERFDGLGSYQEMDEHGNKLRDDGEVQFPDQENPVAYESAAELMDLLAQSERVRKNFTRKVTQFALGRPLVESDSHVVDEIHKSAQEGGGTYVSLITSIVMSDLVQMTSMETEQ